MDDLQKLEIYDKAFYIVKNAGRKDGIYFHLEKNGLDIFYSEYADLMTIYFNMRMHDKPVLQARDGKVFFINETSNIWIDSINRIFMTLIKKQPIIPDE